MISCTRSAALGDRLREGSLQPRWTTCTIVGDVRGLGTMIGIELVRDRETKEPFPRGQRRHRAGAGRGARRRAARCTPRPDTWTARNGDLLMLGPPFVLTDDDESHPRRAHRGCDTFGRVSGTAGLVRARRPDCTTTAPAIRCVPERVLLTWELIDAYGLDAGPLVRPPRGGAGRRRRRCARAHPGVHRRDARAGHGDDGPWAPVRLRPGRQPDLRPDARGRAIVAGATVAAARAVLSGEVAHAFNAAGGLHHAMPSRASGFCVYDDPAIAIAWMLAEGVERIAYVDVDVHHGDGPQAIFYDDPRVLTISIHEYAPQLGFFPGTGGPVETGGPAAPGLGGQRAARSRHGRRRRGWKPSSTSCPPPCARSRPTCS